MLTKKKNNCLEKYKIFQIKICHMCKSALIKIVTNIKSAQLL